MTMVKELVMKRARMFKTILEPLLVTGDHRFPRACERLLIV